MLARVQVRQREVRLRSIAVQLLRRDELGDRAIARLAVGRRQQLGRDAGHRLRRVEPDDAHGIVEQRRDQRRAHARIGLRERVDRRAPHQRAVVAQRVAHDRERRRPIGPDLRDRARARDRRLAVIVRQRDEQALRVRCAPLTGGERVGELLEPRRHVPVPRLDRLLGPRGGSVRVAPVARVRHAEPDRQVGARDADAVIAPRIDDHVRRRRHVAAHAPRAGRGLVVEVVRRRRVLRGVALQAERVARRAQLARCGSWQSLHVTPAANIRLWRNEPYS